MRLHGEIRAPNAVIRRKFAVLLLAVSARSCDHRNMVIADPIARTALAPVVVVDRTVYGRMTPEKVAEILK